MVGYRIGDGLHCTTVDSQDKVWVIVSKRHFLPEPWTDFIAAVVGEELIFWAGFPYRLLHGVALEILYRQKCSKCVQYVSCLSRNPHAGHGSRLQSRCCFKFFLPKVFFFISYGSSALMANLWAIGLLLSISAEKRDIPLDQGWKNKKQSA